MISLFELDYPAVITMVSIVIVSGLVHGMLGLGFPMLVTPMLTVFFDVRSAILITLFPTVIINLASIWGNRHSIVDVRRFLPLTVFVLIGSISGAFIIASVDPGPFRLVLAGLIILYLCTNRIGRIPRQWLNQNLFAAMAFFGLLSGLAAGTTNTMVPILLIFLLSLEVPRATTVPVLNACFLIGKMSQIVVLSIAGLVSLSLLYETAPLALLAVCALMIGQKLRDRLPLEAYRKALHGILAILALVLVSQYFQD